MKKINTSLACPNCTSSNIQCSLEYHDKKIKHCNDSENTIKIATRKKVYNCKCNSCGHNYIVNHGIEKYVSFEKPYQINCLGDVNLLAVYDTESGFEHGYKICSITQSPYDKNTNSEGIIYLMLIEGEEFPILLSKQTIDKIIDNPNKARSLVINNILSRHK